MSSRAGSGRGASHPSHMQGQKKICKGKFETREKNKKRQKRAALHYLDRCMDSFLLLGSSWFGRSLVTETFFFNPITFDELKTISQKSSRNIDPTKQSSGNSKFVLKRIRDNSGTSGEYIGQLCDLMRFQSNELKCRL